MKKKLKILFILVFLLTLYTFICAYSYVYSVSNDLSNSIFRLHVVANSNSYEDQNLKYKIRDSIIDYMNSYNINFNSKDDALKFANDHKSEIQKLAQNIVNNEGFNYQTYVEIGKFEFPTKCYGDITFPSGTYDAINVKIGQASGKNWWCVLYPSLCFVDLNSGIVPDDSKEYLKDTLSDEDYKIISDNNNVINFKFKIIEFFNEKFFNTTNT